MKKVIVKSVNLSIWIIPLVSLIVGGWLIYKYYMNLGPLIEIKFESSGGLEPRKSVVKFRDMKVGIVEDIKLLKKGVLVKVRMHKDIKPYLNPTTKFWIVKPRVEVGKVSGIEALFSGPYIQMEAKYIGFLQKKFVGYNEPPIELEVSGGKVIKLHAKNSYGLTEKMPVYFRGIEVGSVRNVVLRESGVDIYAIIKKPFVKFINDSTKFWNLRGVDITFNKDNLQFQVPSLGELVVGGIEFDTLEDTNLTKKSFYLYASRSEAYENRLGGLKYQKAKLVIVDDKNAKLKVGNGVFFKGFRIGYVEYLKSELVGDKVKTTLYLKINDALGDINEAIKRGLLAKVVDSGIFGGVRIELFFGKCKGDKICYVKSKDNNLLAEITKFVKKLNSLKLDKTLNSINSLQKDVSKTLYHINKTIINANSAIDKSKELIDSLKALAKSYSSDSKIYKNSQNTLKNVNKTLYKLNKTLEIYQKVGKKVDNKLDMIGD